MGGLPGYVAMIFYEGHGQGLDHPTGHNFMVICEIKKLQIRPAVDELSCGYSPV
jgi:hypothetical protein